ncbi:MULTISPECIES: MbcA/ParS/Xre antitoxin family protein [unclassified Burkholderia]|uniref:MbcA/ParS/Xre antitoxin family protein n=1 Tax=unclassified Burkholderia TaxID=2613784 RepID=UPI0009EA4A98|nr:MULTISPECIES: MbcA/ParS/Xre antitoxin family protein [unclassified Burkholderia]
MQDDDETNIFPPTASQRPVASARKRGKEAGQVTTKPAHVATGAKSAIAFADSSEVKSVIANAVQREVTHQHRVIGATPAKARREGDTLRAVRAYAREVFGGSAKAKRWLERPSVRLGGKSPIT